MTEIHKEITMRATSCLWADVDGSHETGCGEIFVSEGGTLTENGFCYCIFCGDLIEESGDYELKQAVGDVLDFVREQKAFNHLLKNQQQPDGPIGD